MNHFIFLEKRINGMSKKFNLEDIKPKAKGEIQVASDTFFIKDTKKKSFFYCLLNTFFVFLIYFFCSFGIMEVLEISYDNVNKWGVITTILFALIIAIQTYIYFRIDNKKLILDRMKGMVTLPGPFFLKGETIDFRQLEAFKKLRGIPDGNGVGKIVMNLYLKAKYGNFKHKLEVIYTDIPVTQYKYLNTSDIESYWNFIVWYMDKNRPLPPGTAFDKYRQRDFERRKAEGFPLPLYESVITISEFNDVQQLEYNKSKK